MDIIIVLHPAFHTLLAVVHVILVLAGVHGERLGLASVVVVIGGRRGERAYHVLVRCAPPGERSIRVRPPEQQLRVAAYRGGQLLGIIGNSPGDHDKAIQVVALVVVLARGGKCIQSPVAVLQHLVDLQEDLLRVLKSSQLPSQLTVQAGVGESCGICHSAPAEHDKVPKSGPNPVQHRTDVVCVALHKGKSPPVRGSCH